MTAAEMAGSIQPEARVAVRAAVGPVAWLVIRGFLPLIARIMIELLAARGNPPRDLLPAPCCEPVREALGNLEF